MNNLHISLSLLLLGIEISEGICYHKSGKKRAYQYMDCKEAFSVASLPRLPLFIMATEQPRLANFWLIPTYSNRQKY